MSLPRRSFVTATAAAGGALAASTLPAPAIAQGKINWNMAMAWPSGLPGVGRNPERLAEMIEGMTEGRLTIKVHGAGELVPPFEVFDAVSQGTVQAGAGTPYFWGGKNDAFQLFTGVPFGMNEKEFAAWYYFGDGKRVWEEVYGTFGVQPFYLGSSGVQAGGWFRSPLNAVEDLRGLKIRIAGLGGEVLRRLGAATQMLPPPEIFPAMQNGTIDATEWVGPWNDMAFGLQRIAKHYYMPAFHEPGPGLEFMVGKDAWDELPEALKLVVDTAARAIAMTTNADFQYHNTISLPVLERDHGVTVHQWPDDIRAAIGSTWQEVWADFGTADPLAAMAKESYVAYLRQAKAYARHSDLAILAWRDTVAL